jgi:transposase-like protein
MKQTKQTIKCVHCGQSNYKKKGFRQTQNRGKIQRYICNECGKQFTADNGFYRMRNSERKITSAIDLYFSNLSSRKVRNHFRRHWEHNASHETVLSWCRKYVLKVQKYVDTLHPELSGEFYADETDIPRGTGVKKKGGDILWCNVDWGTRYINGFHYSVSHGVKDAITFLKNTTKEKKLPKFIQTDAAQFYPRAMRTLFYDKTIKTRQKDRMKVKHIVNNVQKTGKHNVRIETVFMKIKDRVDDFRGLKALWSAPILLAGIVLQHNYIEAHTTTGVVPCELAGLKLETGVNRWLGLIRLASIR